MIQTWEQYQFVHQALSRYGRILAGENVTTPSTAGSVRSPREQKGGKDRTPVDLKRRSKHRRSTSDTNLPSPKELKTNLQTVGPKNLSSHRRNDDVLQASSTPPCHPHLVPCLISPTLKSVRSVSSPTIQSPFGRMCLQSKDMNAGASPKGSTKFQWPSDADVPNKCEKLSSKENPASNNASPKRFKCSFTALALPRAVSAFENTPQSENNTAPKGFSFDLSPPNHPTLLTNGYIGNCSLVQSPSAAKSSPRSVGHFVFPSPGAR